MPRTKSQPSTLPRLSPFKKAAEQMNVPYSTMRDAFFRGDLAIVRIGRSWYVAEDELARFVERNTERHAG